jgi:hypothetical protein
VAVEGLAVGEVGGAEGGVGGGVEPRDASAPEHVEIDCEGNGGGGIARCHWERGDGM